ncbi:DUF2974 domain-containing protein [Atopobacter sp. AH10]|uniref:Mbeg1-like protein n=1 Tax=Atopobacter sp. AH10 TaxID=2315861 RepID=UPI000EF1B593|nr:Mbeg1-like protein [Atopobacter sp. AH10]RLK63072.1 DUF2974 domain-containing protein [Atopobacter sp. AH10]
MRINDYLEKYKDVPFSDSPVNEVDFAILAEISYVTLDPFIPRELSSEYSQSLQKIYQAFSSSCTPSSSFLQEARRKLLRDLVNAKRFKDLRLYAFSGETSQENKLQFAAFAVDLGKDTHLILMRGTDGSFVGWQEDFNLASNQEMPSQQMATDYLTSVLKHNQHPYFLIGHSKGGNLVVESASRLHPKLQQQIEAIYSFDGPGVFSSSYQTPGYKNIQQKILNYLPQDSRFGTLLENDQEAEIIYSAGFSYLQHIMLLWQIDETYFLRAPYISLDSQATSTAIDIFQAYHSLNDIQRFFDIVFSVMYRTGFKRWETVSSDPSEFLSNLYEEIKDLPSRDRQFVFTLLYDFKLISHQVKLNFIKKEFAHSLGDPLWLSYRTVVQHATHNQSPYSIILAIIFGGLALFIPFQSLSFSFLILSIMMIMSLLSGLRDLISFYRDKQRGLVRKELLFSGLTAVIFLIHFLSHVQQATQNIQIHFFVFYLLFFAILRCLRLWKFYKEQASLSGTGISLLLSEGILALLFAIRPSLCQTLPYFLSPFFLIEGALILYSHYRYQQKRELFEFISNYLKDDLRKNATD